MSTDSQKTFIAILAQAANKAQTNGKIDMGALMENICGNYTTDSKGVIKNEYKTQKSAADRGRND